MTSLTTLKKNVSLAADCLDTASLQKAIGLWSRDPASVEADHGPISEWTTCRVTDFSNLFNNAFRFNADLSGWDTGRATSMDMMFRDAYAFNGDISDWDVAEVRFMSEMFSAARALQGNAGQMALFASSFDVDLSQWDVSKVTTAYRMFYNARSFDRTLRWCLPEETDVREMFYKSPGSIACDPTDSAEKKLELPLDSPPDLVTSHEIPRVEVSASNDVATSLPSAMDEKSARVVPIVVAVVFLLLLSLGVALKLYWRRRVRRSEEGDKQDDAATACSVDSARDSLTTHWSGVASRKESAFRNEQIDACP